MKRRSFLTTLAAGLAPISLPAFQASIRPGKLKITGLELWRLDGHRENTAGLDKQFQVNPLHIYEELRPKPYADSPNPQKSQIATNAIYLKIQTDGGVEGLYGPIEKE